MTAEHALLIIFGMLAGGAMTAVSVWQFARRLEYHGVSLAEWSKPIDWQAPRKAAKVIHDTRLGS